MEMSSSTMVRRRITSRRFSRRGGCRWDWIVCGLLNVSGWNRLYQQLQLIINGKDDTQFGMAIDEVARVWTATQQEAWASMSAVFLGVPVTETLGSCVTP